MTGTIMTGTTMTGTTMTGTTLLFLPINLPKTFQYLLGETYRQMLPLYHSFILTPNIDYLTFQSLLVT